MKIGSVDVEVFSRNLARLVEEGGRALAAYLKPREEGRDDSEQKDEIGSRQIYEREPPANCRQEGQREG